MISIWFVLLLSFLGVCSTLKPFSNLNAITRATSLSSSVLEKYGHDKDEFLSIPRIDSRTCTKDEFRSLYNGSHPVILTNMFDFDNEWYTEELLAMIGEEKVQFDVKVDEEIGDTEVWESQFHDFVGIMIGSRHERSFYLMNEELMTKLGEGLTIDFFSCLFPHASYSDGRTVFDKDYFQNFPDAIRPNQALIVGGTGARSFLHADPFEWSGVNYMFEGRKVWTFIPPGFSLSSPSSPTRPVIPYCFSCSSPTLSALFMHYDTIRYHIIHSLLMPLHDST